MSRHNRRRTRGGRKHSSTRSAVSDSQIDDFDSTAVLSPIYGQAPVDPLGSVIPDVIARVPATPQRMPLPRTSTVSARVWHNRYVAWQNRDRKQKEERARLEMERARIFGHSSCGGDGGEDADEDADGLEEKMLEYFGGLEWLDT